MQQPGDGVTSLPFFVRWNSCQFIQKCSFQKIGVYIICTRSKSICIRNLSTALKKDLSKNVCVPLTLSYSSKDLRFQFGSRDAPNYVCLEMGVGIRYSVDKLVSKVAPESSISDKTSRDWVV